MGTIEHNREACIGCGACIAIHPEGWKMGNDGKTGIVDSKLRKDGWEEKKVDKADCELHKEAAESCPVECIYVTNDKGEKIL